MTARDKGSKHYTAMNVQPWDVIDTWPLEQRIGYYRGNAIKYLMRVGSKDAPLQEVEKAAHYCEKLAETLRKSHQIESKPTTDDGWREWRGNHCPVKSNTRVFIRDSAGVESKIPHQACLINWTGISAYKVADDGWVKWNGGARPVNAEIKVFARFSDGFETVVPLCAGLFDWASTTPYRHIIAYKVADA